jgi:hypothetical protein
MTVLEPRHAGAYWQRPDLAIDARFGLWVGRRLGKEARGALLHQAVQRVLLGAMTLVADRGSIGRTTRRLQRGSHALLMPRLWCLRGLKSSCAPLVFQLLPQRTSFLWLRLVANQS